MRHWLCLLMLTLSAGLAAAQTPHGIELGDLDRTAQPCTDFFEYANGGWRASNPIPASMPRWSRRWAAGEQAKEQLKVILDEAAAMPNRPMGSIDQLIGDHYAACMNEPLANQLGITPLESTMAAIEAIDSPAALQAVIRQLHAMGISVPFAVDSLTDPHDPASVIANVAASGLGLPDRDYYFKTEPRFVEARTRYLLFVRKLFMLAGEGPGSAESKAKTSWRSRRSSPTRRSTT
jgi:endothelin-converting enzyme/putative endopeptidase